MADSELSGRIARAVGMLCGFTAEKIADGELSETEIEQLLGELSVITDALQRALGRPPECRPKGLLADAEGDDCGRPA